MYHRLWICCLASSLNFCFFFPCLFPRACSLQTELQSQQGRCRCKSKQWWRRWCIHTAGVMRRGHIQPTVDHTENGDYRYISNFFFINRRDILPAPHTLQFLLTEANLLYLVRKLSGFSHDQHNNVSNCCGQQPAGLQDWLHVLRGLKDDR